MPRRPAHLRAILLAAVAASVAGCAAKPARLANTVGPPSAYADLALDQLQPPTVPPGTRPTTAVADEPPPAEALALYARARAASIDGDRAAAIAFLERAAALDPASYSVWYDLGRARAGVAGHDPGAIDAFRRAADLDPTRLDVQIELAKQLLVAGVLPEALDRLRLAVRTAEYADGAERWPEADFLLAHALREAGYDRAALDRFELLTTKLDRDDRGRFPTLGATASTRIYLQIGDLYLRRGQPAEALAAYRRAEATTDGRADDEVLGRVVQALVAAGRRDDAFAVAADAVRRSNASAASVATLREAYRLSGRGGSAADALRDLHRRHPDDLPTLFALCDTLAADGKPVEADRLLAAAWRRSPGSARLVVRRSAVAPDAQAAARVAVEALAVYPQLDGQLDPVWRRLVPVAGRPALTPAEVLRLDVLEGPAAAATAARAVAAYEVARRWSRSADAEAALDAATRVRPAFAPAFWAAAEAVAADAGLPPAEQGRRVDALVDRAAAAGDVELAAGLRVRAALCRGDRAAAAAEVAAFDRIYATGSAGGAPFRLARAAAAAGSADAAVVRLNSLVADFPTAAAAYAALHARHAADGDEDAAEQVLADWSAALPDDPEPDLRRARDLLADGRPDAAELVLAELEADHPWNAERLELLRAAYKRTNRGAKFAALIEQALGDPRKLGPGGVFRAGVALARHYVEASMPVDAVRVIDLVRPAAAGEPDRLADLADLHLRVGGQDAAIGLLEQAVSAEPTDRRATLALSELLADRRLDLPRAERLARSVADREPGRPAAVAAVGWVFYCQGKYAEARTTLAKAVAMTAEGAPTDGTAKLDRTDPQTLDRLGDALYRLGDRDAAGRSWDQARRRLADPDLADSARPDLAALRLTLPRKIQRLQSGQEVPVASATR